MAENLMVYTTDDRFATMSQRGVIRIWEVRNDGSLDLTEGPALDSVRQIELQEKDLEVTMIHEKGQPVNQGPRGIRITHLPTGLTATSVADVSQLENKAIAIRELDQRVKNRLEQGNG